MSHPQNPDQHSSSNEPFDDAANEPVEQEPATEVIPEGQPQQSPLEALKARRETAEKPPNAGVFRVQTPESAVEREPTLAESRERDRVRREAQEREIAEAHAAEEAARKKKRRRNYMIGGGVGVGLVAILAAAYLVSANSGPDYENAQCVNDQNVVVDDKYCSDNSTGHSGPGGMFFFFVGGNSYRYSYGSNAPIGAPANGQSSPKPGQSYSNAGGKQVTSNGSTGGPVNRGGLGSNSGNKSGSGGGRSSGG